MFGLNSKRGKKQEHAEDERRKTAQENDRQQIISALNAIAQKTGTYEHKGRAATAYKYTIEIGTLLGLWFAAGVAIWAVCKASHDSEGQRTVMARQLDVMGGQLDEMKGAFASQRAYIFFTNVIHKPNMEMRPGYPISVEFGNLGISPAIVTSVASRCGYFDGLPPAVIPSEADTGALQFQVAVKAGGSMGAYKGDFKITPNQITAAKNGRGSLRCVYNVAYQDVRWVKHIYGLCLLYGFNVKGWFYCPEPIFRETYEKID